MLARLRAELEPWVEKTAIGTDSFSGRRTRRTGGLVARSEAAREVVQHPLALAATKATLTGATSFHLHLTQVMAIGPGEPAQMIHRDPGEQERGPPQEGRGREQGPVERGEGVVFPT